MDEFGYCLLANAPSTAEVSTLRTRLLEQVEAEAQLGETWVNPIKRQLVRFLVNKGKEFRDPLSHPGFREVVDHVLGPAYLLSLHQCTYCPFRRYNGVSSRSVLDAASYQNTKRDAHKTRPSLARSTKDTTLSGRTIP